MSSTVRLPSVIRFAERSRSKHLLSVEIRVNPWLLSPHIGEMLPALQIRRQQPMEQMLAGLPPHR
jgi:hypothetical protein